jgi:hypothetical protein
MPFVSILWDPEQVSQAQLAEVRDALVATAGPALMAADPQHIVNERMIDVKVTAIGPLDRVRSALFITVHARYEPLRASGAANVVAQLLAATSEAAPSALPVVELVLTNHVSSLDYSSLE